MILLDTQIWVGWMNGDAKLPEGQKKAITDNLADGIGVSVISCWEVAQLVRLNQLHLAVPAMQWVSDALTHPNVVLLDLTAQIAVESTLLPDPLHRDPADRFLVAMARAHDCPLVTVDERILNYPHVRSI